MTPTNMSEETLTDVDLQKTLYYPERLSHWHHVRSHAGLTQQVIAHQWRGKGTEEEPYLVEFMDNDPRNPMLFPHWKKWVITHLVAVATLAVSFASSAYSGGVRPIAEEFHASNIVITLGISMFVLGFALGPLIWAPLCELYGRQAVFIGTYAALTFFSAGSAGAQNIESLIILRFFAGAFGSSPLTNAGGTLSDMFDADERGVALCIFAAAPFLGPTLGPIVGGFVGETIGWRWIEGIIAIFCGIVWIVGSFYIPETYAPVIFQKRAIALTKLTGKKHISIIEKKQGKKSPKRAFSTALKRPWILLFLEPIVLMISIYMAIIYGTLYMLFGAFPIVYQEYRGWSEGIGGLAFLGIMIGMMTGVGYSIWDNGRYKKVIAKHGGEAPPEARLPPAAIGAVALPIGMFWFAWTNSPSIHWSCSIIAGAPFGFGMVLVFLGCMNYLIDSYTIYAASVLAANSVLRSLFGAGFPLFTSAMYSKLGIHWASSIPAFLALACLPFPFLFYKYGESIRMKCKYAAQAHDIMESLRKTETRESYRRTAEEEEKEALEKGTM